MKIVIRIFSLLIMLLGLSSVAQAEVRIDQLLWCRLNGMVRAVHRQILQRLSPMICAIAENLIRWK